MRASRTPRKRKVARSVYGVNPHDRQGRVFEFNVDIEYFEIYLSPEAIQYEADDYDRAEPGVEYQMSERFIKNLNLLSYLDPARPILVHMKTCGGDWVEGMAIFDAICVCPNPITIVSKTHARSMSSLILQAADKRYLWPNSYFLIHEGYNGASGTNKFFMSFADWNRQVIVPTMMAIYVETLKTRSKKHSRRALATIQEDLQCRMDKREDVYWTSWEAVEEGWADGVFCGGDISVLTKYPRSYNKRERVHSMQEYIREKVKSARNMTLLNT